LLTRPVNLYARFEISGFTIQFQSKYGKGDPKITNGVVIGSSDLLKVIRNVTIRYSSCNFLLTFFDVHVCVLFCEILWRIVKTAKILRSILYSFSKKW